MITIILVIILILALVFILKRSNESFDGQICMDKFYPTIVDPYSIFLHRNISEKEDQWNYGHSRKLYYYRDLVPQRYKE